ncbi:uncharacterized protein A4U43_C07F24150 [Asparagus officinalis]|uniref:Uncharacterized protein n=1 Tax=Asparagus officinalis TaxID=4686 RepID=A0A5P1EEK7_ASPOF|nr:uncharacterized protein A4U43_C07F24150 [Asparagus officinalis]
MKKTVKKRGRREDYSNKSRSKDAKAYQNKAIEYCDDICVLMGTDREISEGAEQIDDPITTMDMEGANEGESSSREVS